MNSLRDSPFFWMMLARYQSTLRRAYVAQKLLVNSRYKWFQEQIDPMGILRSHILVDDDKQNGR
jgi:hypothetical protein